MCKRLLCCSILYRTIPASIVITYVAIEYGQGPHSLVVETPMLVWNINKGGTRYLWKHLYVVIL